MGHHGAMQAAPETIVWRIAAGCCAAVWASLGLFRDGFWHFGERLDTTGVQRTPCTVAAIIPAAPNHDATVLREQIESRTDVRGNDSKTSTALRKALCTTGSYGATTHDENAQRLALDENGHAAHRKRPPPFDSVMRTATYSRMTAAKLTLE